MEQIVRVKIINKTVLQDCSNKIQKKFNSNRSQIFKLVKNFDARDSCEDRRATIPHYLNL